MAARAPRRIFGEYAFYCISMAIGVNKDVP
jgi:hypothetical protein